MVAHNHLVRGKSPDTVNGILQKVDKSHVVGHILVLGCVQRVGITLPHAVGFNLHAAGCQPLGIPVRTIV